MVKKLQNMTLHPRGLNAGMCIAWRIGIAIVCVYVAVQAVLGIAINVVEHEIVRDLKILDQNMITSGYVEDLHETCPAGNYASPMPKRTFPEERWSIANIPTAHVSVWVGASWHNLQWLREQRDSIQSLSLSLSQYSTDRMWLLEAGCRDW